jgi:hypothetical protein
VLTADTDTLTVLGTGEIDLETERLDMQLRSAPKKGAGAGAKLGLNVADKINPFKLSGTLAEPKLAIDPTVSTDVLGQTVRGVTRSGSDGLAAALLRGETIENPCQVAIEAATGTTPPSVPEQKETEVAPTETQPAQQPLTTPTRRLKKLLGR